jgi:hypothetical protein
VKNVSICGFSGNIQKKCSATVARITVSSVMRLKKPLFYALQNLTAKKEPKKCSAIVSHKIITSVVMRLKKPHFSA